MAPLEKTVPFLSSVSSIHTRIVVCADEDFMLVGQITKPIKEVDCLGIRVGHCKVS